MNGIKEITAEVENLKTLGQVLEWAQTKPKTEISPNIVEEVIVQDEYNHDVIVPFRDLFWVFGTT